MSVRPRCELIVAVTEQRVDRSQVQLVAISKQYENLQIGWIEENLVKTNGPLAHDEGIRKCLSVHRAAEAKRQEISDAVNETERLAARQDRLRENIKTGDRDQLTNRWRTDLDEAEQAIRKIEEEQIPALRQEEKTLRSKLKDALMALSVEWSGEAP
jgi:hypothetical protein